MLNDLPATGLAIVYHSVSHYYVWSVTWMIEGLLVEEWAAH